MEGRKMNALWLPAWAVAAALLPAPAWAEQLPPALERRGAPAQPGNRRAGDQAELPPPRLEPPGTEAPTAPAPTAELSRPAVAPPLTAASTAPAPRPAEAVLAPGQKVTLRIIRVFPAGGLSPGERLLNGHPPIQPGDRFLAEVLQPPGAPPDLVGGVVTKIVCPGCFGRRGYVVLQMGQLVSDAVGMAQPEPWQVDLHDRRFGAQMQRAVVTTLFAVEGAAAGAAIGAQRAAGNMAWISGGTGIGLLLGVAYASLQRGTEPDLEPGDTFQVVVGTTCYRPIPREWQTILYPAPNPFCRKVKHP